MELNKISSKITKFSNINSTKQEKIVNFNKELPFIINTAKLLGMDSSLSEYWVITILLVFFLVFF